MSTKKTKSTASKAVNKTSKAPSRRRRRATGGGLTPAWFSSIVNPFDHAPSGVPDDACTPSLKFATRDEFGFTATAVAASTVHGFAFGVSPYLTSTTATPTGVTGWITKMTDYNATTSQFVGPVVTIQQNPVNMAAMMPPFVQSTVNSDRGYHYRMTACALRMSYLGRETDRAGEVLIGLAQSSNPTGSAVDDNLNAFSLTYGRTGTAMGPFTIDEMKNRFKRLSFPRSEDGTCEALWIPMGTPKYRPLAVTGSSVADFHDDSSPQLFVIVRGDLTSSANVNGNTYRVELTAHWEIIPQSRVVLASQPTPSPSDPIALATCLNKLALVPSAYSAYGGSFSDGHQGDTGSAWESVKSMASNVGGKISDTFLSLANDQQIREGVMRSLMTGAAQAAVRNRRLRVPQLNR